jgi:menaquinol-cytochrome c reductase iron-sulfur subunit
MNRRDFHRIGTVVLGNAVALALAVPGVAYLLDPLRRKSSSGGFQKMAKLSELTPGVPRSFAVIAARTDAWVKYPKEPVGSVWLVRQETKDGEAPKVVAFTAECPHLGCAVNLAADGKTFLCPCHTSAFTFDGTPTNRVPPRPMDTLAVELSGDPDPEIRVKFERFRTQTEAKVPLA